MLLGLWISVLLSHAKIDNMNDIRPFSARTANEEIVGLYIAVDEVLFVDRLHTRELLAGSVAAANISKDVGAHHLLRSHDYGLYAEFTAAHIEQIFKTWSEEVDD